MAKHTRRDLVWDAALHIRNERRYEDRAIDREFHVGDVLARLDIEVSDRHVRDTLDTMADLGWLEKYPRGGRSPATFQHPDI